MPRHPLRRLAPALLALVCLGFALQSRLFAHRERDEYDRRWNAHMDWLANNPPKWREGLPQPWMDLRPTRKPLDGPDRRVRIYGWYPRPGYLDLAPVVFPGPPPPLKPAFANFDNRRPVPAPTPSAAPPPIFAPFSR